MRFICSLAKQYDEILISRLYARYLIMWRNPVDSIQEGGLKDYWIYGKRSSYVLFINNINVYAQFNSRILLHTLASKCCGNVFWQAIRKSIEASLSIIGCEMTTTIMGVFQGGMLICSLFTLNIGHTVENRKQLKTGGLLHYIFCCL